MSVGTFKITEDHLFGEDPEVFDDRTGLIGWERCEPDHAPESELTIRFKLYDDDGILYYGGIANDEGLEVAYDWGYGDSGTTRLDTFDNGEWSQCIS